MKRSVLLIIAIYLALFLLGGCAPASQPETASSEVTSPAEEESNLEEEKQEIQSDYDALKAEYDTIKSDYEDLQYSYQRLMESATQATLRNPTWAELKEFLKMDDTDTFIYDEEEFDCTGYAITLRDRARELGFRCAFVEIMFYTKEGHALNCFQTTDKGTVFVDTTSNDGIAYVVVNQPYGVIQLNGVKSEYISCAGVPSQFWKQLTYETHPNPFAFDYYSNYQKRAEFFSQSIAEYNRAVNDYNSGGTTWSPSQLDTWQANLEALRQDLSSSISYPKAAVEIIQIYWN